MKKEVEGNFKKITVELNEFEVHYLLEVLGNEQWQRSNRGLKTHITDILIDKVYRAMGVRL